MAKKGHVTITEAGMRPLKDSTHIIRIYNTATGECEIEMLDVAGGIFIAQAKDEQLLGTDQIGFGTATAIVVCALKAKSVVQQMVKQDPQMGAALEHGAKLAREAGFETTLN